jgi:hypothetical protein
MRHAVHDQPADRGPIGGAAVGVQGVIDPVLGFEQRADPSMMLGSVGSTTALLQHSVQMGAQHFVISVRTELIDGVGEELMAF